VSTTMETGTSGGGGGGGAGGGKGRRIPLTIAGVVVGVLLLGGLLYWRAVAHNNHVALADAPKGVTVERAVSAQYQPSRRYVGTMAPWIQAQVGPQLVSAYVDTVLVRPGAVVKRNQVLATLDCRNVSASQKSVAMQARAVEAMQAALAKQAGRVSRMLDGGFVSPNEVDQRQAESASKEAQLLALQAQMTGSELQVSDCVLRAPFDGEISERMADPGAFVRPGSAIVSIVDRNVVRVTADVPEEDFDAVAPETPVRVQVVSTGQRTQGAIARRAPAADLGTRTVHVEIDLPNTDHGFPVNTTAILELDVGQPRAAARIPLTAATVRGEKADVFVVRGDLVKRETVPVLGEQGGALFLDPKLSPGTMVVTQGRTLLVDGDKVTAVERSARADAAAEVIPSSAQASGAEGRQ
jgi:membrane fusion protein (multidrug efflux system)